jgi:hypothetical protein
VHKMQCNFQALYTITLDWSDIMIGLGGLLLVVSHFLRYQISCLLVEMEQDVFDVRNTLEGSNIKHGWCRFSMFKLQ